MRSFELECKRVLMGRLEKGDDVLEGLTEFCVQHGVKAGSIQALGLLQRGRLRFYDQATATHHETEFEQAMELASLVGNISSKDGEVFLHCHVVLADRQGRCFGGHLTGGNIAFVCEFVIFALEGTVPERTYDEATGLYMW